MCYLCPLLRYSLDSLHELRHAAGVQFSVGAAQGGRGSLGQVDAALEGVRAGHSVHVDAPGLLHL